MNPRAAFADDALLDSLNFLDRNSLDAVRLVSLRFDNLVEKMNDVCLRGLLHAAVLRPFHGEHTGRFLLRATAKPGSSRTPFREYDVAEADVAEEFKGLVRCAYVGRLGVYDVVCTDGLLLAIKSVLPTVWVKEWAFDRNDFGGLSPAILFESVLSTASISAVSFVRNRNTSLAHISDRLLIALAKKGAPEIVVGPQNEHDTVTIEPCGVTDRGVFHFLTAGTSKKRLRIRKPQLSASFFEHLHELCCDVNGSA